MKNYYLIFICFSTVLFSCTENKQHAIEIKPVKKAIGKLVTDSLALPVFTKMAPSTPMQVTITSKPFSLDPRMGKEAITTITPTNGLPAGTYGNVVQDNTGNLWFGNYDNIIKYDGMNFTSYPVVSGKDEGFLGIAMSNNNEIWTGIIANSKGRRIANPFIFNGISFEPGPVMRADTTQNFGFPRLFPQSDGAIWVVMYNPRQIFKFEGRQLKLTIKPKDLNFKRISDIDIDRQGNTWFLDDRDSTLTRYDGKTFQQFTGSNGLPKKLLFAAYPFNSDSIYLSTSDGTYFYDGRKSTKLINAPIADFLMDKNETLWLNSIDENGLRKMSPAGITSIGKKDGLDLTRSITLGTDKDDNVWGLSRNVINRLYKPVTKFDRLFPDSGSQQGIRSFYNDKQGNSWFGSSLYGISCYNGKTLTNYSFLKGDASSGITDNNIGYITQDKSGNLWISTIGGSLIKYDGHSFLSYNLSQGFATKQNIIKLADSKGNIWFSKFEIFNPGGKGIACFNGKEIVNFTTAQGLCNNSVNSVFEDHTGTIWFGTSNGLSRLRDGRFTTYKVEDGLLNNMINAIAEDKYGNLWLRTDAGISRFNGEQFKNYTTEDGLLFLDNGPFHKIIKDSVNDLFWLSSNIGFTAMKVLANHPDSVVFENYTESDGFPVKGTTDFMIDPTGAILYSENDNSITRFDYKKVKQNSKPFNLHINQIRLNNEPICWSNLKNNYTDSLALKMEMQIRFGKLLNSDKLNQMARQFSGVHYDSIIPFDFIPHNLSLPYKANSISFDFAAIDPHFSKNTRYQYKLEGFDKTWSPLSKNTNASFGNLREGSYTFKLKALNPYGKWSEMSYSFKILPPWYRTWWAYTLYALLFVSGIYLFIRWRTKALQKEKIVLEEKVTTRTSELNQSLQNLKATQSQLIQSEKMASLGELTAGIAHEIQNPLNFVNNFSEVSNELIDEMNAELNKGDIEEAKAISSDIKQNLEKINHHGKRAADIVKGMLQHSSSGSGKKEPTNINALADEYLRLAYHGLRAKDKSFNATMKTDFDESIGNINIIPQDMGRVILNLITNAFYVVNEKSKKNISGYEPTVTVKTSKNPSSGGRGAEVLVIVKDNGNGIPQKILDKIFQPFFTTKPTGQGTGLGLSLSYDIVKAHGGELKVETKEGEGSEFIISLPG